MTTTAIKLRSEKSSSRGPKENIGPGQRPLYFNNVGLFSDPYLLKLAEPKKDDFINKHWETESLPEFSAAYEWMLSSWDEMKDILPTLSEAQLEDKWIKKIFEKLGWEFEVQDRLKKWGKTEIPDFSLFDSHKTYLKAQGCKTDEAYFSHVLAVADAKQMGTPLNGSKLDKTNPSYQINWYQQVTGKTWGILTDGRYWRLYSSRSKSRFTSYYEVNIEKLLTERDDESFKYFFNFFRKEAFVKLTNSDQCLLDVFFEKGERYAYEIETRLKDRAFRLVELIAQGFTSQSSKLSRDDLDEVYSHSLYYLFRLMFILNCEAKGLLNVDKQDDYYTYSLRSLCMQIKSEHESNQTWVNMPRSYNHINSLFTLFKNGDKRIGIHGFGREAFEGFDKTFYKDNPIPDSFLNKVLLELAFGEDKKEHELRLIDYKRLSADHLGSVFEGLLEYKLDFDTKTKSIKTTWTSKDKKDSGSFYTPDYIVDSIVRATLDPIVRDLSYEQILNLKIIDIAMGSGHFLLGVIRYLEEVIMEKLSQQKGSQKVNPSELRWDLLHSCIYGIDINPLAVELAKFSLWIYTAQPEKNLEPLNNRLFKMDTLKATSTSIEAKIGKINVIVGNPPYKVEYDQDYKEFLTNKFPSFALPQNIYTCFIEKSIELLKNRNDNGFGFIIPNTFISGKTYVELRQALANSKFTVELIDLGDKKVFPNADVYTAIVLGHHTDKKSIVSLKRYDSEDVAEISSPKHFLEVSGSSTEGWHLSSGLTKYFDSFPTIGDCCEVKDIGFNYWSEGRGKTRGGSIGDRVLFEGKRTNKKDLPYAKGRDINKFSFKFGDRYLKHDWQNKLVSGDTFRFSEKYFNLDDRIVYRQTSSEIIATLLPKGMCNDKTIHIIVPQNDDISKLYLLGYLNSALCTNLYRELVHEEGQAFAQVKTVNVKRLPFVIPKTPDELKCAKTIEQLVEKALKGKYDVTLQKALDQSVQQLFDKILQRLKRTSKAS